VLERASLPASVDLFRLKDFETMLICTERFHEAVLRLQVEGLAFQELPAR
jgi:hypothetical protein